MSVRTEHLSDGLRLLTLDRPEKRNALNRDTISELERAAKMIAEDQEARCVVLSGSGPVFSAGADVSEMSGLTPQSAHTFIDALRAAIDAVYNIPVPVICRLHGVCLGGALELAACCDYRIAEEATRFAMPEVHVGIPSVIQAAVLPRLMGASRAGWFMLSGAQLSATKAYDWGFIDEVVDESGLQPATDAAVALVLRAAPQAVRTQKRLLRAWQDQPLDDAVRASVPILASSFETGEPEAYLSQALKKKNG